MLQEPYSRKKKEEMSKHLISPSSVLSRGTRLFLSCYELDLDDPTCALDNIALTYSYTLPEINKFLWIIRIFENSLKKKTVEN